MKILRIKQFFAFSRVLVLILLAVLLASCVTPQPVNIQPPAGTTPEMAATVIESATPVATTALPTPTLTATLALATPTLTPTATPTETPATPSPSPTVAPTKKPVAKATSKPYSLPYVIFVNKKAHVITIYGKDGSGNFTTVVAAFKTATGSTPTKTPTGKFTINKKLRWKDFGSSSAQYASCYYGSSLFFHSPLFRGRNNNKLKIDSYRQIGTNATAGCMRTTTGAAYWIYKNCAIGTRVEIVNSSTKGTSASAIPSISNSATYDPTDPFKPVTGPTAAPTAAPTDEPTASPTATVESGGSDG